MLALPDVCSDFLWLALAFCSHDRQSPYTYNTPTYQKEHSLAERHSNSQPNDFSWVRAAAANQHLGAVVKRRFFELVVIDQTGVRVDFVGKGLEENGRGAYFFTPRGVVPVFVNEKCQSVGPWVYPGLV